MIKNIETLKKDSDDTCYCEKHLYHLSQAFLPLFDERRVYICNNCKRTYVIGDIEDDDIPRIEEVKRAAGDKKWVLTGYVRHCKPTDL